MKRRKLTRRHYIKQGKRIIAYLKAKYEGKDQWISLKDIYEEIKAQGIDGGFWSDDVGNTLIVYGYEVRKPAGSTGAIQDVFFNFKSRDTGWNDTEEE